MALTFQNHANSPRMLWTVILVSQVCLGAAPSNEWLEGLKGTSERRRSVAEAIATQDYLPSSHEDIVDALIDALDHSAADGWQSHAVLSRGGDDALFSSDEGESAFASYDAEFESRGELRRSWAQQKFLPLSTLFSVVLQ